MFIAQLILFQVFVFALLVILLRYVISKRVKVDKAQLQRLSEEYMEKEQAIRREQEKVRGEYDGIINKAKGEASQVLEKAEKEAKEEAAKIIERAQTQGEQVVKRAQNCADEIKKDIEKKIEGRAVDEACRLIGKILPGEIKKTMHQKWVRELMDSGFEALSQMNIPGNIKEIKVYSAYKLSNEDRDSIKTGVKGHVAGEVNIIEETNPDLVAGIMIKIGNVVLDGTLIYKAEEKANEVKRG